MDAREGFWTWRGDRPYVVRRGDRVLLSVSGEIEPTPAIRVIQDLGLVPNHYARMKRKPGRRSSIDDEALDDLYQCPVLVCAISETIDLAEEFFVSEIEHLIAHGVACFVYIVGESGSPTGKSTGHVAADMFPPGTVVRSIASVQDIHGALGRDLEAIMQPH